LPSRAAANNVSIAIELSARSTDSSACVIIVWAGRVELDDDQVVTCDVDSSEVGVEAPHADRDDMEVAVRICGGEATQTSFAREVPELRLRECTHRSHAPQPSIPRSTIDRRPGSSSI
jgi:hypothetical protein